MHCDLVLAQRVEGVDEQRAGILREIISLKRRYNQLSAIFRLPIDLLRHVFGLRREVHYYVKHWSIGWIPEVTHVCHAWREVALQSPLLWNDVFVETQSTALWATELTRRSKNVPMALTMNVSDRNHFVRKCGERLLQENIKRLQKIRLNFMIPPPSLILPCNPVETGQHVSAIALEELHVIVNVFRLPLKSPTALLTDEMLRAPAMKKISLHNCSIDWNAFGLLRNLRHLHVEKINFAADADVNAVRNALSQMPKLETLKLRERQIAAGDAIAPLAPTQSADLPLLRSITIHTESSTWLSSFLPSITYGPQRDMKIRGTYQFKGTDTSSEQFDCTMQHGDGFSIRCAHLRIRSMMGVMFDFNFQGWRTSSFIRLPSVDFRIEGQYGLPDKDIICFIQRLRGGLFRLQNLEVLNLTTNICIPANIWVGLFGCLPQLHTIEILDKITELELFSALVYNAAGTSHKSGLVSSTLHPTLPFRTLQSISILGGRNMYSDEDNRFILQCLRKRFHLHAPLKKLEIYHDHGLDLFALREVVESVVFGTL